MLWRPLGFASALIPALLTGACVGVVESPYSDQASGGSSGTASGGSGGTGVSCTSPSPGTAPLRRLSNAEYRNSVTDLFATIPDISSLVASATREFPAEPESLGFRNSARFLTVQSLSAQKYLDAAEAFAEKAAAGPGVVPCTPEAGAELNCARAFIQEFGQRAYRRPLTSEEATRFESQFATALEAYDFATGVEWTIFGMLQSPAFLYRVELGKPSTAATTRPTAYETATRLSYLFWQSMPDASLFAAAKAGELDSANQVEQKAREMLADPRSARLFQYFAEWLDLDRLEDFSREDAVFPDLPDELPSLYRDETRAFVQSLLGRPDGGFAELVTAPYTFANQALAAFYGLGSVSGTTFARVDDPRRSGILTQAMLVAQDKPYRTSIVRRGLKVRTDLLCQNVSAPPNDVELTLDSISPELSQRQRLAQHRENPLCAGCHVLLDPIGVVFESFDAVGRYRSKDEAGQVIDTTSEISDTRDANGPVANARELGELLAASTEARDCYVTQTFRFFFGREVEPADACSMGVLRARFAEKNLSLSELLVALTRTDAFLYRPTLEASK